MKGRVIAGAAAAALMLAGCGGSTLSSSGISGASARELQADVLSLTQTVAAKNWNGARIALATVRSDLAAAQSAGTVGAQRAAAIQAAADAVAADIPPLVTATPTPTPTATKTTAKAPAPPAPAPKPAPAKHHHGGDG